MAWLNADSRLTHLLMGNSVVTISFLFGISGWIACAPTNQPVNGNTNTNGNGNANGNDISNGAVTWREAFDTSGTGALSSIWGSGPNDIFAVGGKPDAGEVYRFDGVSWSPMSLPQISLLVWVFGFGPDDVYAVGEQGGAIHFDGVNWNALDSGTDQDLWGVWGASSDDLWIVGGNVGEGEPTILHFDGQTFDTIPAPQNDRGATSLFKVWGIGAKVFAVGERGLIIELIDGQWSQVPGGANADDDFVSLWGTGEDNIVAVGGRGTARIAVYDGANWQTELFSGIPGLNAVFMLDAGSAVVGGTNGYVGLFDLQSRQLTDEVAFTNQCVHGIWVSEDGRAYAVGGRFTVPYAGIALIRD